MATYVLVHGGFHGGWCWRRLAPLLRFAGHEVYTPTLTGLGERAHLLSPDVGLETHITDVTSLIAYEDLHDVILVGHSYGGVVVSGVADRMPEHIAWLVFLDATILANGESLLDASPGLRPFAGAYRQTVNGVDVVDWPAAISQQIYGVDGADWDWMAPKLSPHPWRTFEDKLTLQNESVSAEIPRAVINCAATLKLRPDALRPRYSRAERVWEIDAPHDLMLTHSDAVADMLAALA